jgi:tRNA nucleotidyltransferase (CCA-adding enzyme)
VDVITCHLNADFDAVASMMAAKKLYPDAHLVFPGAQERSIREFFLSSTLYALRFDRIKNIDFDKIDRLILVDTKSRDRIGRFAEILDKPGLKIHIYDHHPFMDDDIRGEFEMVEQLGACTTLFVELFQKKRIDITPLEATVMALGIYEETGSLAFASTTPRDITAAAWVLSKGASLNIVSDFITRELDAEQISLLNDLLQSMTAYNIGGIKIVIAQASTPRYIQDLAIITHKIRDIENLDALFCVVRMEDRVHLVARSRVIEVDAGRIASELGGGGHPTAASATIRDTNLEHVVERLLDVLKKDVHPVKMAQDIMTKPVITIRDSATIAEAGEDMTRYSVNVLPVLRAGRLVGLVTREVVQKSIFHGLGERPVSELMSTDFKTISEDTSFKTIEDIMIRHTQRFLPVVEKGKVIGAITRTDLLRTLQDGLMERERVGPKYKGDEGYGKNIGSLVRERLPAETLELLHDIGKTADELGISAFAVGGFVRDLLINVENFDLDIVVEGNGVRFAYAIAKNYGARVRAHHKFGTAVVIIPGGLKFDVATARTEYYEYPAALPTVELGSIKKDLYRRDFTVNALAIRINEKGFGELMDFFGGQRDLKDKTIRVLHNLSLIEDPTRAFRAIRFEVRMGFTISKHTQELIKSAVKMELFHRLAGGRIYAELRLIFKETAPLLAMKRLEDFGLLRFIHPKLKVTREMESVFSSISETLAWFKLLFLDMESDSWLVYFMGLFDPLTEKEAVELAASLTIPERHVKKLRTVKREGKRVLGEFYRQPDITPYQVYLLLSPLPVEALLYMMAKTKSASSKKHISLFLTQYRDVQPDLTGDDLLEMGLQPGPHFKKLLASLLEAKMDGVLTNRAEEERFIKERIRKQPELLKAGFIVKTRKSPGRGAA